MNELDDDAVKGGGSLSETLRSLEEIKKAIKDYLKLRPDEFNLKYGTNTANEAKGFVKALRWVLKL